uniref:Uncharacterized protein n=1 Tax=Arundo donax TaxID=35708 RepID=A0A0A9CLL2_ARUDO
MHAQTSLMVRHHASLARTWSSYRALIRHCSALATNASKNCGRMGSGGSPFPSLPAAFAEGGAVSAPPPSAPSCSCCWRFLRALRHRRCFSLPPSSAGSSSPSGSGGDGRCCWALRHTRR